MNSTPLKSAPMQTTAKMIAASLTIATAIVTCQSLDTPTAGTQVYRQTLALAPAAMAARLSRNGQ